MDKALTDKHRKGKISRLHWTHCIHRRDGTTPRRGAWEGRGGESQRGRVRKQRRGYISMWWTYGCVSVILPSNLWSIGPGLFSVALKSALFSYQACVVCIFCVVCVCWCQGATLAMCSAGLGSSDDTFKEQRALGSCRGQQFGLALRGQVLQVMSAPNWCG